MKYVPHHQPLETIGFGETRNYAIAATGKAFRNLMDGLYGRKVEAVVREISTNALDSHIQAGYPDRRFLVTLPTALRPQFRVRDYGVGMPHEQVMERYSTLFDSTKDQSNQQNGMLGLGSKSPFAYTDGFTLRCWDGAVRRTYASYLGEGGVPLISVADVSPSTEPRGVEVSFPVKAVDFTEFHRAARRVYKGFCTKPLGLPADLVKDITVVPDRYGDGWAMVKNGYLPSESNVWALQGCVYYPVSINVLETDYDRQHIFTHLKSQILLDFPMGSLEFTPGRETLSYNDTTKEALRAKWKTLLVELDEAYAKEFEGCTTDWERAVRAEQMRLNNMYGGLYRATDLAKRVDLIGRHLGEILPYDMREANRNPTNYPYTVVTREGKSFRTRYRNTVPSHAVYYGNPIIFVERDKDTPAPWRRLGLHLYDKDIAYAIVYDEGNAPDLTKFGNPPVTLLKDLPAPPKAERSPPKAWDRYRVFTAKNGYYRWEFVKEDSDLLKGVPYLFEYDDWIVEPGAGPAKDWRRVISRDNSLSMYKLDKAAGGKGFALIRMRGNEVYGKWAKHKLFKANPLQVVAKLTPPEVARLINIQNNRRFGKSWYYGALKNYSERVALEKAGKVEQGNIFGHHERIHTRKLKRVPIVANPLEGLRRFGDRVGRIPAKEAERLGSLLNCLPEEAQDYLITRGLALGLEVLPEPCQESSQFGYELLPLRWENLARIMAGTRQAPVSVSLLVAHLAESEEKNP